MRHFSRTFAIFMLTFLIFAVFAGTGQAAEPPQKNMTVQLDIDSNLLFWEYSYLTRKGYISKPAAVKIAWDWGAAGETKLQTIATAGQKAGKQVITTPKDELVSIRVVVCDAKDNALGSISFMVRNKGQVETVHVAPPEFTEPVLTTGNF